MWLDDMVSVVWARRCALLFSIDVVFQAGNWALAAG